MWVAALSGLVSGFSPRFESPAENQTAPISAVAQKAQIHGLACRSKLNRAKRVHPRRMARPDFDHANV